MPFFRSFTHFHRPSIWPYALVIKDFSPENGGFRSVFERHFIRLAFAEGGSGLSEKEWRHMADFARIGTGYRLPLGYGVQLKFLLGVQLSLCHPYPYDKIDEVRVDANHLGYSDRTALAIQTGIALEW